MITFNYGGKSFDLRNTPDELTLVEFEQIFNIQNRPNNKDQNIQNHFEVFELLGVPDEILDKMTQKEFIEAVEAFNTYEIDNTAPKEVVVGKRKYIAYEGEEFEFGARDLSLIEKAANLGDGHFPSYVLAIIFKDEELTRVEHKDWNHIKHKATIFRKELSAKEALPYLGRVARRTVSVLDNLNKPKEDGPQED